VREHMKQRKAPRTQSLMEVEVAKTTVKLGPEIKAKIGQQLRAMYSDVVNQGVPDRFAEILRRLDDKEAHEDSTDGQSADDEGSNAPI